VVLAPVAAALGLLLLGGRALVRASDPDALLERYVALVQLYANGDRSAGVAALGAWRERDLRTTVDRLAAWPASDAGEPSRADVFALEHLPLASAILLHAERAKTASAAGASDFHLDLARRLAALLLRVRPKQEGFVRRYYIAMTLWAYGEARWAAALDLAAGGRRLFPRDPELLLSIGSLEESLGCQRILGLEPSPENLAQLSVTATFRSEVAEHRERQRHFLEAEKAFSEAIAADPPLMEAQLRLGRVLWRRGKPEAARQRLESVIAGSREPAIVYLAHLFLGRIHEDAQRLTEAEREYRAALDAAPHAQTPELALAHLRQGVGDEAGAGAAIRRALEPAPQARLDDAFWHYASAWSGQAGARFEALLREASP
jgi:tetratricopeptide (TPR) repeat protein